MSTNTSGDEKKDKKDKVKSVLSSSKELDAADKQFKDEKMEKFNYFKNVRMTLYMMIAGVTMQGVHFFFMLFASLIKTPQPILYKGFVPINFGFYLLWMVFFAVSFYFNLSDFQSWENVKKSAAENSEGGAKRLAESDVQKNFILSIALHSVGAFFICVGTVLTYWVKNSDFRFDSSSPSEQQPLINGFNGQQQSSYSTVDAINSMNPATRPVSAVQSIRSPGYVQQQSFNQGQQGSFNQTGQQGSITQSGQQGSFTQGQQGSFNQGQQSFNQSGQQEFFNQSVQQDSFNQSGQQGSFNKSFQKRSVASNKPSRQTSKTQYDSLNKSSIKQQPQQMFTPGNISNAEDPLQRFSSPYDPSSQQ